MYKIIGGDQHEYGPVSADDLKRWIREGRLNARSMAKAEGATEWKPLSSFPEFGDLLGTQTVPPPLTLTASPLADLDEYQAEILARTPELRIGECLSRGWEFTTKNFKLLLVSCAIVWGIGFCQFVPLLDWAYKILSGALYGGLYLIFLKRIRGQTAAPNEVFWGFNFAFAQLVLAGFVGMILSGLGFCFCVIPGIYLSIAWIFGVPLVADKRMEFWPALELSRKVVTKVWFEMLGLVLLAFLPMVIVKSYSETRIFTSLYDSLAPLMKQILAGHPPLNVDAIIKTAMRANIANITFGFFGRIVLLFNMPFAIAVLMHAYENLFGPRPGRTS